MSSSDDNRGLVTRLSPGLSGKQRRQLRGLGHHLKPVVMIGHQGVSDAVVGAFEQALLDHELIKVRLLESVDASAAEAATELAARAGAALVQRLGRVLLFYRAHPEEPRIHLVRQGKGEA